MKIFKPPKDFTYHESLISVFLAGSIEMGQAEDWQAQVENALSDYPDELLTVLNPRRDDFQVDQEQSIDNPYFNEQVTWEMVGLEAASYIFMYLHPETKSPISLLELGLYADFNKLIVVCPDGFWRKGNVEMVTHAYDIPMLPTLEDGIRELREVIDYDKDFNINE